MVSTVPLLPSLRCIVPRPGQFFKGKVRCRKTHYRGATPQVIRINYGLQLLLLTASTMTRSVWLPWGGATFSMTPSAF